MALLLHYSNHFVKCSTYPSSKTVQSMAVFLTFRPAKIVPTIYTKFTINSKFSLNLLW